MIRFLLLFVLFMVFANLVVKMLVQGVTRSGERRRRPGETHVKNPGHGRKRQEDKDKGEYVDFEEL